MCNIGKAFLAAGRASVQGAHLEHLSRGAGHCDQAGVHESNREQGQRGGDWKGVMSAPVRTWTSTLRKESVEDWNRGKALQ